MTQAILVFAQLVEHFTFELPKNYELVPVRPGLVQQSRDPIQMKLDWSVSKQSMCGSICMLVNPTMMTRLRVSLIAVDGENVLYGCVCRFRSLLIAVIADCKQHCVRKFAFLVVSDISVWLSLGPSRSFLKYAFLVVWAVLYGVHTTLVLMGC